jgi:hypothetical protein
LEREVQKGVHEKIQGGYGKYQGSWRGLALDRISLMPIRNLGATPRRASIGRKEWHFEETVQDIRLRTRRQKSAARAQAHNRSLKQTKDGKAGDAATKASESKS